MLGKTANCQVAVSLHEVCSEGAAVLNWRLYSRRVAPKMRNGGLAQSCRSVQPCPQTCNGCSSS